MDRTEWLRQAAGLLRRKYGALEEIQSLTRQMGEAAARNDQVSFRMLLKMRAKEMAAVERAGEELRLSGEESPEAAALLRCILGGEFLLEEREDPGEEAIRRLRLGMRAVIDRIREEDRRLNERIAGDKSWYRQKKE